MIRAAGAVVWRRNDEDQIEILLVHRPRYGDWSLPKGKAEASETQIACAFREVMEETGSEVRFGQFLAQVTYENDGETKLVDYWAAKHLVQISQPNVKEIDLLEWARLDDLERFQLRQSDHEVIMNFAQRDPDSSVLILLRHAQALSRSSWSSDDGDRPLSQEGVLQSRRLISNLTPFEIREIHTSSAVRCYDTINPLARALGIEYFFSDDISEYCFSLDHEKTYKYFEKLLQNDYSTVVCSHNPILPKVLSRFFKRSGFDLDIAELQPSDSWVIHHIDREVVAVDYLPGPRD
jgi:8-oxo-dGTP diphosphatase